MTPNRAPPPSANFPDSAKFKETPGLQTYLQRFKEVLVSELRQRPPATQAVSNILLMSPDGTVYAVSVDNAGNLVTTAMTS